MKNKIFEKICDFFRVSLTDVIARSHSKECVYARNFIVFFLRENNITNSEISILLNIQKRSVSRCYSRTKYYVEHDKEYKSYYNKIKELFS